jgi:hypothetical protein
MSARTALIKTCPAVELPASAHPLRAWRERQRLIDPASPGGRTWTVSDAARHYSAFIGRAVGPHTWRRWELAREDPQSRIPSYDDMIGLRGFTGGELIADSFYPERDDAGEG